jgi:hypothetical protein
VDSSKGVSSAYCGGVLASDGVIITVEAAGVVTVWNLAIQEFDMSDGHAARWYRACDSNDRTSKCGLREWLRKSGGRHHKRDHQKKYGR